MLVVSRKPQQEIVFPGLGITVSLLNIRGTTARIGISAPKDVQILRGELGRHEFETPAKPDHESHHIRNVMNSINLAVMLYKRQMQRGLVEAAANTFVNLVDYLDRQTSLGNIDFDIEMHQRAEHSGQVMVVEDDSEQRSLLASWLEMEGYQVTTQSDGQEAWTALSSGDESKVVLLDWTMPKFDGPWFVDRILSELGDTRPKICVLSGTAEGRPPAGIDAWIPKPVNEEALLARLQAIFATCQTAA